VEPETRVRAAVARERPDRPPFGWWGHTYAHEWSPRALADVTIRRQRTYGWDFVKLQPRASCFAEAFGSEYRPSGTADAGPVLVRPAVADPDDWARVPPVDASASALADQVEAVRLVADALGPGVPVIQTVFSPLMVAGYLAGEDRPQVARTLVERPDVLAPALGRIAEALADFVVRSVDAGAAGIFFAISGFASAELMTAADYERLALPHDRRVVAAIPGRAWFDVLHLCGPRQRFELAHRLDLPVVSWSVHEPGNPSLTEGSGLAARAAMGGMDHVSTLVRGTPEEVAAQAREAASSTGGAGVIVAPGCSVPPAAPEENVRAIGDAVRVAPV
jgi:uroporphyrinogen decarboxylase